MARQQVRGWVFTLNNPTSHAIAWPDDKVRYAVWQREVGAEGTPHLQGYMEFHRNQAFSACKKILPTAHWEPRQGTRDQARAYAMKEETREEGPWELGTWETEQGKRSDLEAVAERLKQGATLREIAEEHPAQFIQFHKGFAALKSAIAQPRQWKTNVIVRWGEPGSGKTKWVYDNFDIDQIYVKPPGDWYDGYDGQPVVLIDDFYGDLKYTELLRLLDRYPMTVPVKGGFVNWAPRTIVITSNAPPEEWYKKINDKRALLRRIEEVVKVGDEAYTGHENFLD